VVFSSYLFLFYFLPAALLLYYAGPRRARHLSLTIVSYVFYGWANPLFLPLLLGSTAVDYAAGRVMAHYPLEPGPDGPRRRARPARIALVASICSNLTLLGFFKYYNFGAENIDALAQAMGLPAWGLGALRVTLPLGISFYTFQSMSYAIDVYRGDAAPIRSFIDFACFVSMFPQLVAGPIIRFSEVADQLRFRTHTTTKFSRGIAFLGLGLAKKVLVANPCGKIADLAFDAGSLGTLEAWYGAAAYAFQIYFDFSGYSDMAIGLGRLFGIELPQNFNSPYKAASPSDFWRRWHMTLSAWLRDYLYITLGGNRCSPARRRVNLMVTMILGGLWHGANWTFAAWGTWHGLMLVLHQANAERWERLPIAWQRNVTFFLMTLGWVFFRAETFGQAAQWFAALSGLGRGAGAWTPEATALLGLAVLGILITRLAPNSLELPLERLPPLRQAGLAAATATALG
jgi:alginate O-acetyltransferase complex protein AlgI